LAEATTWLEERELEEEAIRREFIQAELAVKASPSQLLAGDPEAQAMDASALVSFKAFADLLASGKQTTPPEFPPFLQVCFRKYIEVYGIDNCLGKFGDLGRVQQASVAEGIPSSAKPGDASASSAVDGAGQPMDGAPSSDEGDTTRGANPATPELRPEAKKQKTGGGDPPKETELPPIAPSMGSGGVGLGRGIFGTPLTAAHLSALPGTPNATSRSRSRSRATSGSAPPPTELGQEEKLEEDTQEGGED
jgi:hypothetical protein